MAASSIIHAIVRGSSADVGRGMSRSLPSTRTFTDGGANYKKNNHRSKTTVVTNQPSPGKTILYMYGGNSLQVGVKLNIVLSIIFGFWFEYSRCFPSRIHLSCACLMGIIATNTEHIQGCWESGDSKNSLNGLDINSISPSNLLNKFLWGIQMLLSPFERD